MKPRIVVVILIAMVLGSAVLAQNRKQHLNPMIDLLDQHKVIVGGVPATYPRPQAGGGGRGPGAEPGEANTAPDACGLVPPAPRGGGGAVGRGQGPGGGNRGGFAPPAPAAQTMEEAARMTLALKSSDFLNGSMEGGVDNAIGPFSDFMKALSQAGALVKAPTAHLSQPYYVKTPKISRDPEKAILNISKQLNTGLSGVIFVAADCAREVQLGLAAMRPKSAGGRRPSDYGDAPAYWGLTPAQYEQKADVWGFNPNGELVNWTIIESLDGIKNVRDIAKEKGIGVLIPGAGTLGGVFTTTNADGQRVRDNEGWENGIQKILAACKEFKVNCGFPASTPAEIEMRFRQGFNVFVLQSWSPTSFDTMAKGRELGGRAATND